MIHHAPTGLRHRLTDALLTTDPTLRITVSARLTEYIAGEAIRDTPSRADRAPYQAKAAGRNRTVVADAESVRA